MKVRVRFEYDAETGEVRTFLVEDVGGTRHGRDHDAVHNAVTADVAGVIEQNARYDEVIDDAVPTGPQVVQRPADEVTREREARPIDE
jgi:FtsH ternary system-associated peptide